ncbi:MAG: hypothetical protein WCG47_06580, partial [Dermatophilaceae bacterium]
MRTTANRRPAPIGASRLDRGSQLADISRIVATACRPRTASLRGCLALLSAFDSDVPQRVTLSANSSRGDGAGPGCHGDGASSVGGCGVVPNSNEASIMTADDPSASAWWTRRY